MPATGAGSLAGLVDRISRPAAVIALGLLAAGVLLGRLGEGTERAARMPVLVLTVAAAAAGLLVLTATLPHRVQRRLRAAGLAVAGLLAAVLQGNDLSAGAARLCLLAACVVALGCAVPALVAQLEAGLDRPVRRL